MTENKPKEKMALKKLKREKSCVMIVAHEKGHKD